MGRAAAAAASGGEAAAPGGEAAAAAAPGREAGASELNRRWPLCSHPCSRVSSVCAQQRQRAARLHRPRAHVCVCVRVCLFEGMRLFVRALECAFVCACSRVRACVVHTFVSVCVFAFARARACVQA